MCCQVIAEEEIRSNLLKYLRPFSFRAPGFCSSNDNEMEKFQAWHKGMYIFALKKMHSVSEWIWIKSLGQSQTIKEWKGIPLEFKTTMN